MFLSFKKLTSVDKLFALLRILAFIGGSIWVIISPLADSQQQGLFFNFAFFGVYSIILYYFIFTFPNNIRKIYKTALYLDLIFIFWLIRLTGGYASDFFLAYLLLIALHSFYFGLTFGFRVIILSCLFYLLAGNLNINSENLVIHGLRMAFFFLVGISMGLLSRKERMDKERIQNLNLELKRRSAELEQEKDKLSNILMGIDAGLILLNTDREIIWMNKVSERWFGSMKNHVGQECHSSLWHNQEICKSCPTLKCLESKSIENTEIEEISQEDKKAHYFRITSAPLCNEDGQIERILELIQDITEERELQLHILQSSKLAAMGELASGTAHEINNPLSIISICVQDISEALKNNGDFSKEINQNLKAIKNEIQRCKRITTGLLDITPRSEHRRVPLNINHLLRNVRLLVRYKAEREKKHIQLNLNNELPMIMGEADTLSQVFLNLILNAIEFTPTGKSIEIRSEKNTDSFIAIRIIDNGCGIPSENLNKVFKPFFTTKPPGMGTGLGLPISLRIVKNHDGDIKIENNSEKGTTFTVFLPTYIEPSLA